MSEHAWTETEPRFRVAGEVAEAPSVNTADMIRTPGGTFRMGSDKHYPEEAPVHRVTVSDFWIDRTPVTNRQFRAFVQATGHVTFAEIPPDPKDYPGALPYSDDDGHLVALRQGDYKYVFSEQRKEGTMGVWAEPFTTLRCRRSSI